MSGLAPRASAGAKQLEQTVCVFKRTKTERLLSYLLYEVNQSARMQCQVLHQAFSGLIPAYLQSQAQG